MLIKLTGMKMSTTKFHQINYETIKQQKASLGELLYLGPQGSGFPFAGRAFYEVLTTMQTQEKEAEFFLLENE